MEGSESSGSFVGVIAVICGVFLLLSLLMSPGLALFIVFGGDTGGGYEGYGGYSGYESDPGSCDEAFTVREGALSWPLANYGPEHITSPFGWRSAASTGGIGSTNHKGIDIGAPSGTLIHAAAAGTVTLSAYSSSMGNYVEVDHGDGVKTRYQHMSKRMCSAGDAVEAGAVIGRVGSTGNSTGPHLHFEVWINGKRVNPMSAF